MLLQAELVGDEAPATPPLQVLAFVLVAVAIVALIAWLGTRARLSGRRLSAS